MILCQAGTFQSASGSTTCSSCPPGYYCPDTGLSGKNTHLKYILCRNPFFLEAFYCALLARTPPPLRRLASHAAWAPTSPSAHKLLVWPACQVTQFHPSSYLILIFNLHCFLSSFNERLLLRERRSIIGEPVCRRQVLCCRREQLHVLRRRHI